MTTNARSLDFPDAEPDEAEKYRLVDQAYDAVAKMEREVRPTLEEWQAAIAGPARKFWLAAAEREDEATGDLPLDDFRDKVERWFKNIRECYRAVVRARAEPAAEAQGASL